MRVNWTKYILLMLPIRLRKSKVLFALLWAISSFLRKKYDKEYNAILRLEQELRYTSCIKAMKELLRRRFGEGIEITDGTEYNISFFKENELLGETTERITLAYGNDESEKVCLAVPQSETSLNVDFIVKVPQYMDKERIRIFIERYVFCGINFKTMYK